MHAFVVMPDHFHLLITIGPELSIERAIQFIKGGFAFRAARIRIQASRFAKRLLGGKDLRC